MNDRDKGRSEMEGMKRVRVALVGCALLACCLLASAAFAAEPAEERDEYVATAEPICKTNVLANKKIFKGAKTEVKHGELKRASKHFFRAATAFGKTVRQLTAIPQPPTDSAKLTKWLGLLKDEKVLIEKIGRALAAENKHEAERISVDLNRNSNRANNAVLAFEFDYCRIEPSRFN
jgi:hypothetical protein